MQSHFVRWIQRQLTELIADHDANIWIETERRPKSANCAELIRSVLSVLRRSSTRHEIS